MKFLIFLLVVGSSWGLRGVKRNLDPPASHHGKAYREQWYQQKLDHFDPTETSTWAQRYWENYDHYKVGGPAFIFIGGEAEANPAWLDYGVWSTLAKETNAAMFLLEHRYYGNSRPTPDMSAKNMRYLSSRQALEDLAMFMTSMNNVLNITGPWVSFGGSYPGSLSAWLRLKYPHILTGAVSSSGPLFAKLDFFEYLSVVEAALDTTGSSCNQAISEALSEVEILMQDESTWPFLTELFRTCKPFNGDDKNDVLSFIELLIDNLAGVVQYNGRQEIDIDYVCRLMSDESIGSPLERFSKFALLNLGSDCFDYEFSSFLSLLTITEWSGEGFDWRPWIWQTCTEFGWYQTTNQPDQVYGNLLQLDFFKSWCRLAFDGLEWSDKQFEQNMIDTNAEYGGFNPSVDNVVFVHGSIDPWHAMGVLEDLNENAPSIYIEGTSHCADMYNDAPGDSPDLLKARRSIENLVKKWVKF